MPSTIVHAYIGLDTLEKLNNKPKNIIKSNIDNYKIYCQNMDILYFYRILLLKKNKVQELGHRIHNENTFDFFSLLIKDNKNNKNTELFTFISGLITHYKADSIIHPYINYYSLAKTKQEKTDNHFVIETYLDNYFINKKMNINHKKYNNSKFIFNYSEKEIIKEEINKVFKQLYNYNNMGEKYYSALKEMKFVFNYARYDKYGIKKKVYQVIDLNPFKKIPRVKYLSYHFDIKKHEYYLNNLHNEWYNPSCQEIKSKQSFFDLYEIVINEASNIINELYEYIFNNKKIDLKKIIGNNSYANGLPLPNHK